MQTDLRALVTMSHIGKSHSNGHKIPSHFVRAHDPNTTPIFRVMVPHTDGTESAGQIIDDPVPHLSVLTKHVRSFSRI